MDLQGLFHRSLHIILLWGLNSTAQVTHTNNLTCPILHARLHRSTATAPLPILSTTEYGTPKSQPPPVTTQLPSATLTIPC